MCQEPVERDERNDHGTEELGIPTAIISFDCRYKCEDRGIFGCRINCRVPNLVVEQAVLSRMDTETWLRPIYGTVQLGPAIEFATDNVTNDRFGEVARETR